jgi:hypothetical protein
VGRGGQADLVVLRSVWSPQGQRLDGDRHERQDGGHARDGACSQVVQVPPANPARGVVPARWEMQLGVSTPMRAWWRRAAARSATPHAPGAQPPGVRPPPSSRGAAHADAGWSPGARAAEPRTHRARRRGARPRS